MSKEQRAKIKDRSRLRTIWGSKSVDGAFFCAKILIICQGGLFRLQVFVLCSLFLAPYIFTLIFTPK